MSAFIVIPNFEKEKPLWVYDKPLRIFDNEGNQFRVFYCKFVHPVMGNIIHAVYDADTDILICQDNNKKNVIEKAKNTLNHHGYEFYIQCKKNIDILNENYWMN
jgi:hypothetical protein